MHVFSARAPRLLKGILKSLPDQKRLSPVARAYGSEGAPRVLVLTDRYLPDVGGSITWFHNVYIRHRPGTVWILTRSYPGARAIDAVYPRLRVVRLRLERYRFLRPESLLIYAKMFIMASTLVLRHQIQVVHAGKNLPEGFVAYLLHRFWGVPYIVYAHGEEITVCSENTKLSRHQGPVYQNAAAVVVNSRYTYGLVSALGVDSRRIVHISPGVDPDRFLPAPVPSGLRRTLNVEGKLVLLTVGRLQRRKGHDKVIEALPSILEHVPNLVYLIAGDGEEEPALKQLAEQRGVTEAVRFLGRIAEDQLPSLYNLSDIFLMANRTMPGGDVEGFGIVFLEASACGKPVVGGRSGGTADAVRDGVTGLLIDGESPESITEAVVRLARNRALRDEMGQRGREMITAEYDWKVVATRIESVMSRVSGVSRCRSLE